MTQIPDDLVIADAVANSFKNFHTRGLSYLCVQRRPEETIKLYFFDGDVAQLPEVVNPHDHRYDFSTHVLAGTVTNHEFEHAATGMVMQRFEYRTPLNGGNGFTWVGEDRLAERRAKDYARGDCYQSLAEDLHTITIRDPETVLMLVQRSDVLPLGVPTSTYVRGATAEAPSLSGLYERFSEDEIVSLLRRLRERTSIALIAR